MAWPESLSADQQATVEGFDVACRSFMLLLAKLNILATAISAEWNGGVSTMVGALQPADVVPNTSGLAGSQPLAAADLTNIATYAVTICDPSNASQGTGGYWGAFIQSLAVKATGINAQIG